MIRNRLSGVPAGRDRVLRRLRQRRQRLLQRYRRRLLRHRRGERRFWRLWRRQLWPLWRRVRGRLPAALRRPTGTLICRRFQRRDYRGLTELYLVLLPLEDARWRRECEGVLGARR